jgi:hypothetical protein
MIWWLAADGLQSRTALPACLKISEDRAQQDAHPALLTMICRMRLRWVRSLLKSFYDSSADSGGFSVLTRNTFNS